MPLLSLRHCGAVLTAALIAACVGRPAGGPAPSGAAGSAAAEAASAHRAWWRAFVLADTATLRRTSVPGVTLTLSSGRTFDGPGVLAEAAARTTGARLTVEWGPEGVRPVGASAAVVTSRVTEADGPAASAYRYLTVVERVGGEWRVAAAQSTRELVLTPRVPASAAGALSDYAGTYRTP